MCAGEGDTGSDGLPDWMRDHSAQQAAEQHAQREAQRAERLKKAKLKLASGQGAFNAPVPIAGGGAQSGASRLPASGARPPGGRGVDELSGGCENAVAPGEEQFLLDAWESEGEDQTPGAKRKPEGYALRRATVVQGTPGGCAFQGSMTAQCIYHRQIH